MKVVIVILFSAVIISLGIADAWLTRVITTIQAPGSGEETTVTASGTPKQGARAPAAILEEQGVVLRPTRQESLLSKVIPEPDLLKTHVLLQNDDRIAFFAVVDSPLVKEYLSALKDTLQQSFSTSLQDLKDEKQRREGKPTRDILSFVDPAISPERVMIVRVRQRLMEFQMTEGKEQQVQDLVEALTE